MSVGVIMPEISIDRRNAVERLQETLRAMSESAAAIPRDELESLIDEANDKVRGRRIEKDVTGWG